MAGMSKPYNTGICQRCDGPIYGWFTIPLCDRCLDKVIKAQKQDPKYLIIGEGDGINDIGPGHDGAMG